MSQAQSPSAPSAPSVLIAGCGYVGTRLGERLAADGWQVLGLRRQWAQPPPAGIQPVTADLTDPAALAALPPVTHVVFAAAGGAFTDEAYRRTYVDGLAAAIRWAKERCPRLVRFVFVSSTGVYGQGNGDWVDETSPVAAGGPFSAARLVEGEELLRRSGLPFVIVRFGGIYGPGRYGLLDSVLDGTARLTGEPHWTNRIHRDDCAGVLRHVLTLASPADLYLGVDDEPAPRDEILLWLAAATGRPQPPLGDAGTTSPQRGNRRCRNARLRASGYRFTYPTYREGFLAPAPGRIKQVILVRQDLKMRRGKEIAQGSHASMGFLTESMHDQLVRGRSATLALTEVERLWLLIGMAKVCLRVGSEEELLRHHEAARARGLRSCLIQDSGRTEFKGQPTYTACAIGPDLAEVIDPVTGDLTLY